MSDSQIILFIITSLIIIITPGQDLVLVLSRGISQGSKAGVISAAGISVGLLGHTLLTTIGVGAVLTASEFLFSIIKYIGAVYLIYLGYKLLSSKEQKLKINRSDKTSLKHMFFTGALSNISNPKITIFYFAYLPQYISSDSTQPTVYLFTLGVAFALLTFIVKAPIGFLAGQFSTWISSRPSVLSWLDRISGSILIGLGIKLAFEQKA